MKALFGRNDWLLIEALLKLICPALDSFLSEVIVLAKTLILGLCALPCVLVLPAMPEQEGLVERGQRADTGSTEQTEAEGDDDVLCAHGQGVSCPRFSVHERRDFDMDRA